MEYIFGITLALFFCAAAAGLGMDRERAFYPAVAIAVASYYLAFAVVDGRNEVMLSEVAIAAVFIVAAVAGFKGSPSFAVVALGGHGVMDAFHHHLVHNTGVPQAWPGFCMTFDVTAAAIVILVMLVRARQRLCSRRREGSQDHGPAVQQEFLFPDRRNVIRWLHCDDHPLGPSGVLRSCGCVRP